MKKHLPLLGAGPAYAGAIALATAAALILNHNNVIKLGNVPGSPRAFLFCGKCASCFGYPIVGPGQLPVQDQREYSEKRPGNHRNLRICKKSHSQRPSAGEYGTSSFCMQSVSSAASVCILDIYDSLALYDGRKVAS